MNIILTPDMEAVIQQYLERGDYRSPQAVVRQALRALQERDTRTPFHEAPPEDTAPQDASPEPDAPSVLEIFRDARAAIPEEEIQTLPVDGAAQHDHYIYGTPKRPTV